MSSTTVYAVASGKGGVGKTTTTVNLGTALAGAGRRVAIVDVDLGMANLAGFVSLSPDGATLHDVLAGEAEIPEATYEVADGIAAIPSGTGLDEFAAADAAGLGDAVDRLRGEFDYVLLDVGAGVSHESVLPLGVADEVVLVSTPEPASVQDVNKTIDLVDRSGGSVAGLVVTRGRPEGDVSHEDIASRLDVSLLGSIPEDPTVRDSVYAGTPLVVHEPEAPAATAYRKLAATLADGVQASAIGENAAPDADATDSTAAGDADSEADDAVDSDAEAESDTEIDSGAGDESDEPASESSIEDAISDVEDAPESDAGAEAEPEANAAETPSDESDAEAAAAGADGGITIPDAEGGAAEATEDSEATEDEENPLELDDDAIPFSGDDADPSASGGDEATADEDTTGDEAASEGDDANEDGADEDDANDADEDGGGFLGNIF